MKASITSRDQGKKVLTFLKENLNHSNKAIKSAIDQGALRLNGVIERFSNIILQKGDLIVFNEAKITDKKLLLLVVIYEEEGFLLCHKPAGLVTDQQAFQKLLGFPLFLVHRLDKDTSGVILIAKNKKMQKKFEALFKQREIQKIYIALVKGRMRKESGTIANRLMKKQFSQSQPTWCSTKSLKGLRAITHWKCLKKSKTVSLIQCEPETGRTHQLRVHFSEMGHPILGDHRYGLGVIFPKEIDRLCLHAYSLTFFHPDSGKKIKVTSPIPKIFKI